MTTSSFHILNGDVLAEKLSAAEIPGERMVCRETLIENIQPFTDLPAFFKDRAAFIQEAYGVEPAEYDRRSLSEFEKMLHLPLSAEVYLWFEDDLFCQTNLWFVLFLLKDRQDLYLYRIFPLKEPDTLWLGFGPATTQDLKQCIAEKIPFTDADRTLAVNLWNAYCSGNFSQLQHLSLTPTPCFRRLPEVCTAHKERFPSGAGRPEKTLGKIILSGKTEFNDIFKEFSIREGAYGFGDSQVKRLLQAMNYSF